MKHILEKWEKGTLISREEIDDGIPDILDLVKRVDALEGKTTSPTLWQKIKGIF